MLEWFDSPLNVGLLACLIFVIIVIISILVKLGDKLDNGELRKAIAITFTLLYIFILVSYYFNVVLPTGKLSVDPISNINYTLSLVSQNFSSNQTQQLIPINLTSEKLDVPVMAITDIFKNFLYVYLVIIAFYFSSRTLEKFSETGRIRELRQSDPLEIAVTQFARGEINETEFEKIQQRLLKSSQETSLQIARNRYAEGKIDAAELDKIEEKFK